MTALGTQAPESAASPAALSWQGGPRLPLMFRHLAFRSRLLLILSLFAIVPAAVVALASGIAAGTMLDRVSTNEAWEQVASRGGVVFDSLRRAPLSAGQRAAVAALEQDLAQSLTQARRFRFLADRALVLVVLALVVGLVVLGLLASRVAGHLSRQLSRPLNELVGWTERIAHGEPLPPPGEHRARGAPEFDHLRQRMRLMSAELAEGRARALESERLAAFRESARRFAHELKNPLTPIEFAVARLEREAPPSLGDAVEVLRTETRRLDHMARAFAQFGRLPEGPLSDVDLEELVRYTARATVPPHVAVEFDVAGGARMVQGYHDALQRALANVLLNAVDACGANGTIRIRVTEATLHGAPAAAVSVRDSGPGIPQDRIETIWQPYVTNKPGGTGLGLAIARQAILAHRGVVGAASPPSGGTEVTFVLPLRHDPTEPPEA